MSSNEFYNREMAVLREELQIHRNHQITFLTTSITTTVLLLGVAKALVGQVPHESDFGVIFLFPLTILFPSWWIFFDKATTISRIVGYYRILEKIIHNKCEANNFLGWENAVCELRKRKQEDEFAFSEFTIEFKFETLFKLLSLNTGNRYWVLCYYIFFALSLFCLILCYKILNGSGYIIMLVAICLFLISAYWNIRIMWQLIYGNQSYDHYLKCWEKVLDIHLITNHVSSS